MAAFGAAGCAVSTDKATWKPFQPDILTTDTNSLNAAFAFGLNDIFVLCTLCTRRVIPYPAPSAPHHLIPYPAPHPVIPDPALFAGSGIGGVLVALIIGGSGAACRA